MYVMEVGIGSRSRVHNPELSEMRNRRARAQGPCVEKESLEGNTESGRILSKDLATTLSKWGDQRASARFKMRPTSLRARCSCGQGLCCLSGCLSET